MKRILCVGLLAMVAMAPAFADEVKVDRSVDTRRSPGQDDTSVQLTVHQQKGCDPGRCGERIGEKRKYTPWSWKAT